MIFERLMMERGYAVSAALVITRPGDEATKFGGLLSSLPFEWTIICCGIPDHDPLDAWAFYDSCDVFDAKGKVVPLLLPGFEQPMRQSVTSLLNLESFDVIVSPWSGSGRLHDIELSAHLGSRFADKLVFGCEGLEAGAFKIDLTETDIEKRRKAVDCYATPKAVPYALFIQETYDGPE